MEVVYILKQTWNNPYDGNDSCIIGAYKNKKDAEKQLQECYEEDKKWIIEEHDACLEEDLENNIFNNDYSYVSCEDYWSENKIIKIQLL